MHTEIAINFTVLRTIDWNANFPRGSLEKALHTMQMHLFTEGPRAKTARFTQVSSVSVAPPQKVGAVLVAQGARRRCGALGLFVFCWVCCPIVLTLALARGICFSLFVAPACPNFSRLVLRNEGASKGFQPAPSVSRPKRRLSLSQQKLHCHHEVAAAPGSPARVPQREGARSKRCSRAGVVATEGSAFV